MSYSQYLKGRAIHTGCEWRLKFKITSSAPELFPEDALFVAQIRYSPRQSVLAELSTAEGSIIRIDGNSLELVLSGAASATWTEDHVVLDIVRADLLEPIHLGFDMVIPVKQSVTRL